MKSIIEQMKDLGYDTENLFMPAEFDEAFLGFTNMDWNNGIPVYDIDNPVCHDFPDIPDGKIEPIFVFTRVSDINGDAYLMFAVGGQDNGEELSDAILGISDDDCHIIYDYDKLVDSYTRYFLKENENSPQDNKNYPKYEDESEEEYRERIEDEATVDAIEWINYNTLRDYSYSHTGKEPLVVEKADYMFE